MRLLERLLNGQADDTPVVRAAYRRAMRLELAFFEAAFAPQRLNDAEALGGRRLSCGDDVRRPGR